jgi:DNA-binding GntR family transcriptional regulator
MAEKHTGGRKITQTERAYAALKRAIVRGELAEGEFISEPDVMRRYGIGRTPFREACNRLHHEGLLEVVPRRGYLVPEISFRAVRDLCEARLVLEGSIAELAALRATEDEISELEKLSRKLAALGQGSNDLDQIIRTNNDFHLLLARMARNRELQKLLSWNLDQTERLMYLELRSSRAQRGDTQGFHAAIAAAIRKRDSGAAREAVLKDIEDAQEATFGRLSPMPGRLNPKA